MIDLKISAGALYILVIALMTFSCAKKGCTDENATNYNADAKKEEGTCRYEGSVVLWFSDSTAQKMMEDTIQSLTIYIDGEIEAQQLVSQSFAMAPDCGQAGAVTITRNLLSAKTKAITYRILDDRSIKRWQGVLTFNGNTCEKEELIYYQ